MKPQTLPMYTDSLPIEDWDPEKVDKLSRKAERNHPLRLMADGTVRAASAAYAVMFNWAGRVIVIRAPRPSDLKLGPFKVDNAKWAKRLNRKIGDVIPGLYLQDLKNGNIGRIRVADWHPERTIEQWLQDEINKDQSKVRRHRRQHNTLWRYNAYHFGTQGIEYRLYESDRQNPEGGQVFYDVHVVISPWANMPLPRDDRLYKGIAGIFTRIASLRKTTMRMEDAHEWIRKDFRERGPLLFANMDAFKDRPEKKRRYIAAKTSSKYENRLQARMRDVNRRNHIDKPERYFYQRTFMKWAFATKDMGKGTTAWIIGKFGGLHLAIGGALILFGMPQVGIPVMLLKIAAQSGHAMFTKAREDYKNAKGEVDDSDEELRRQEGIRQASHQYEPDDPSGGRFDPEQRPYWGAIPNKALHSNLGNKYDALTAFSPIQSVFEEVAGIQNCLVGSGGDPHMVGAYEVTRVYRAGGLDVEYIPELEMSYARLDQSRLGEFNLLSPELIKYFKNMPKGRPVLRVVKDPHSGRLEGEALAHADYMGKMRRLKLSPYQSRVGKPYEVAKSGNEEDHHKSDRQLRREFRRRGKTVGSFVGDFAVNMLDKTIELIDTIKPRL